jgi:2-furoyl-CoA dehydrogenase large subunit
VFEALTDAQSLAQMIPGCERLEHVAANRYRANVILRVGPVRTRYAAEISLSALKPPHSLRLEGRGESSLGAARGAGTVHLEPAGAGTRLAYAYRTEITGKVAAVGARMLEGAARVILAEMFARLATLLRAPVPRPASRWRKLRDWLQRTPP